MGMKILVVEDEFLVRELVADELREAGFDVLEAETGAEAVAQCEGQDPDVLFTDIRLPGNLDGGRSLNGAATPNRICR